MSQVVSDGVSDAPEQAASTATTPGRQPAEGATTPGRQPAGDATTPERQPAGGATASGGQVVAAASATAEQAALEQQYSAVKAAADAFAAHKGFSAQRRQINKLVIVTVGQISGSQEQVRRRPSPWSKRTSLLTSRGRIDWASSSIR